MAMAELGRGRRAERPGAAGDTGWRGAAADGSREGIADARVRVLVQKALVQKAVSCLQSCTLLQKYAPPPGLPRNRYVLATWAPGVTDLLCFGRDLAWNGQRNKQR